MRAAGASCNLRGASMHPLHMTEGILQAPAGVA